MTNFDTGNTGFMLIATSLVMLMTPGLAFFYGGLVGRKNVLTIMIQSFVSMAIVDILWFTIGFSLCFSGGEGAVIGNLDNAFLNGIDLNSAFGDGSIPMYVFIVYQMMFAIITPALITGAFANRVRFEAYLLFLVGWLVLVYFPFVHMVWGNGLLAKWGVRDFAGGIVVHATAGFAALASIVYVGKRKTKDTGPHNLPLVALGTGLLWFGWYGFNAGSELRVNQITALAFLNTDLCASVAAVTWLAIAWLIEKKPKFLGLLTGSIAGLATITPCAGYVEPWHAMIIGVIASTCCYYAINLVKKMKLDDALDVWGVHGVGGCIGTILLGVFGTAAVNPGGFDGAIHGQWGFLGKQIVAVVGASVYAFIFTFVMLKIINRITPVKVDPKHVENGLDEALHGEQAYL